ncbi:hypothetical protein WICPIJ_009404 [Wickerhamomyces pijperi]|uniref:Uncharacterized protein n=1 Tax=Wickerhamomyces pijperi TaxID=599730 RepID=A0A9P8TDP5_WICPI|nr:hypothetical protein WICPIJ_009404 [Wickerhamomyces pijperi]
METFKALEGINSAQPLTVEDFETGKINYSDIMEEATYLREQVSFISSTVKQHVSLILSQFLSFAYIKVTNLPNQPAQQFFKDTVAKVQELQKTMELYIEKYKRLIPLLELANKELKIDVTSLQKIQSTIPTPTPPTASASVPTPVQTVPVSANTPSTATTKKTSAPRKRTYTKKGSISNNANTPPVVNNFSSPAMQTTPMAMNNSPNMMMQSVNFANNNNNLQANQYVVGNNNNINMNSMGLNMPNF